MQPAMVRSRDAYTPLGSSSATGGESPRQRFCQRRTAAVAALSAASLASSLVDIAAATTGVRPCRVLALLPFSGVDPDGGGGEDGRSLLAVAALAAGHFNDRDPAVVPELADGEFAFPPEEVAGLGWRLDSFDAEDAANAASLGAADGPGAVAKVGAGGEGLGGGDTSIPGCDVTLTLAASDSGGDENDIVASIVNRASTEAPLCAILSGSSTHESEKGISAVASAFRLTRVLYSGAGEVGGGGGMGAMGSGSGSGGGSGGNGGGAVSLDVPVESHGAAVITYVARPSLNRKFVTILYDGTDAESVGVKAAASFESGRQSEGVGLEDMGKLELRKVAFFPVPSEDADADGAGDGSTVDSIRRAISDVQSIGYRTVLLSPGDPSLLPTIATEADGRGLLDGSRLWIMPDPSGAVVEFLRTVGAAPSSALDRLLGGMAVVSAVDGFEGEDDGDGGGGIAFLDAWEALTAKTGLSDGPLDSTLPSVVEGANYLLDANLEEFPPVRSSFVYDSVMALGMGACRAAVATAAEDGKNKSSSLGRAIRTLAFSGASGAVSFDRRTGQREEGGATLGVYNVRAEDKERDDAGERGYRLILTSIKSPEGIWSDVEGEPFLYSSGAATPPPILRDDESANFLSRSVHIAGLSLMALSLVISAGSAAWVYVERRSRAVRAAQPQFLYFLCFGSALSASSIAFMSYDESYGWSVEKLSRACIVTTWTFVLGWIVVYGALHGKLMRIHRVLQLKRKGTVRLRQVVLPTIALFSSAVVVLAVWTAIDPFTWVRVQISEIPPVSCGLCMSDNIVAFIIPLAVILVASTVLTAIMAWKARDLPCEFQESTWIFYGVFAHLQSWIIGVPVMVILAPAHASNDASYLGRVMLIFTFSVSMVTLVIWPKVFVKVRLSVYGHSELRCSAAMNSIGRGNVRVSGLGNDLGISHRSNVTVNTQSIPPTNEGPPVPSTSDRSSSAASGQMNGSLNDSKQSAAPGKRKSVGFCSDALQEAKEMVVSLETTNASLQLELEASKQSLEQKTVELDEAEERVSLLEKDVQEKVEKLKIAQERIALLEAVDGEADLMCRSEEGSSSG